MVLHHGGSAINYHSEGRHSQLYISVYQILQLTVSNPSVFVPPYGPFRPTPSHVRFKSASALINFSSHLTSPLNVLSYNDRWRVVLFQILARLSIYDCGNLAILRCAGVTRSDGVRVRSLRFGKSSPRHWMVSTVKCHVVTLPSKILAPVETMLMLV
jgi:hypothetical protein